MKEQVNPDIRAKIHRSAFYALLLLLAVCIAPFVLAQRIGLPANIIVVTNTNDSGPGSLRQALVDANDGDTIDATGVSGTILLTSGELQISHNVTINGPGAENLAVSGGGNSRVFENFASGATISGFTITAGRDPFKNINGGGLRNFGELTLRDSIVSGSTSLLSGGGIFVDAGGTLTVTNSTIAQNFGSRGGGIASDSGATLTVIDSTISGNVAGAPLDFGTWGGGGIASAGQLTVINSTISGNSLHFHGQGAGMLLTAGSATITDSTISDNLLGGSIVNSGAATQIKDTVLNARSTIVNVAGTVTSLGYNLASDNGGGYLTGPGDQINIDPILGPLQDNGGPTFTHELLAGSPAINAGDSNFTPPPDYDQRGPGFDRLVNGRIDIGSFEVQAGSTPTPTPTPTSTPTPSSTPTPTATVRPTPTPRIAPTPGSRPTPAPRP
jgi:Right handed beta helix region